MPSISKAKLDQLDEELGTRTAQRDELRRRLDVAEARARQFDKILDKIRKAATGQSLSSSNQGGSYRSYVNGGLIDGKPVRKVKTEERQAQEIAALNERIVTLESRLAAVVAVAEFAQEHKA